jgi:hypothetical protein
MSEAWQHWPKREFLALAEQGFTKEVTWYRQLVFTPIRRLHDSGYNLFTIIGVDDDGPSLRLGDHDVINLFAEKAYWSIDCLYPSGAFRLWRSGHDIAWDWGSIETKRQEAVA